MDTDASGAGYVPGYKNLLLYHKAKELVIAIYRETRRFPREEMFGLITQMRRAAISVPANVVEGYGRKTEKDKKQFYHIARGSLNELEYYLDLSVQLGYLGSDTHKELCSLRSATGKLLAGLIKSTR